MDKKINQAASYHTEANSYQFSKATKGVSPAITYIFSPTDLDDIPAEVTALDSYDPWSLESDLSYSKTERHPGAYVACSRSLLSTHFLLRLSLLLLSDAGTHRSLLTSLLRGEMKRQPHKYRTKQTLLLSQLPSSRRSAQE